MSHSNIKYSVALAALASAATPGIIANPGGAGTFNLVANQGFSSQPDGAQIYSWGYGCVASTRATYRPEAFNAAIGFCPTMQLPGPTLIVTENATTPVTVTLTNNLPKGARSTSVYFGAE